MQTVKQGIKQMEGDSLEENFSRFLHKYRITPHSTTGISPSELLLGKRLRSRLNLIYPDVSNQVEGKKCKQKCYHDKKQATRTFINGDLVSQGQSLQFPKVFNVCTLQVYIEFTENVTPQVSGCVNYTVH